MLNRRRLLQAAGASAALAALPARAAPIPGVQLLLALDASASMSVELLAFEVEAHLAALRSAVVQRALLGGGAVEAAISVMAFSGPESALVLVPWRRVTSAAEVAGVADALEAAPILMPPGATALGSLLATARDHFRQAPLPGGRQVLDILSNGFNNSGPDPRKERDAAVAAGLTINALALPGEFPWLADYFREEVIGGASAFARGVETPEDVQAALMAKLVTEIAAARGVEVRV